MSMEPVSVRMGLGDLAETIPDDVSLMELAERVVRGKVQLTQQQMRMLIEMLPYIAPKLAATAQVTIDGTKSFAEALERCIERSKSPPPPLLNMKVEPLPASEAAKPFPRSYRRV
jgi:hypothetical protein